MKNKTIGIAATTGLFGVALGSFVAPPTVSVAQQKAATKSASSNLRDVSFDGPPRDGRGGPPGGGFDGPPGGPGGRGGPDGWQGGPPGPPPNGMEGQDGHAHGPMLDEIIGQLNLTDTQKEKVTKMLDFEREKMEALREEQAKLQTQTRANLEAVLTAEQKQQLTRMEAQMSAADGPPGGGRGPRGGGQRAGGPGGERGGPGGERGGPGPRGGGRGGR